MRLNQYLARCGLGSRRAVETLIAGGAVNVNGEVATDLGRKIQPGIDQVSVGGEVVRPARDFIYIMMNKPRGYDVTRGGEHHHRRAYDLLPKGVHPSVQSVGRLDRDSTGLLLFTNDGELANRLMHPRHGCNKTYVVEVEEEADALKIETLRAGITLEDGPAKPVSLERLDPKTPNGPDVLQIVMNIGRNRIVRRMCSAVGLNVITLERTAIGELTLGTLKRGKTRLLTAHEVHILRLMAGYGDSGETPPATRARSRGTKSQAAEAPRAFDKRRARVKPQEGEEPTRPSGRDRRGAPRHPVTPSSILKREEPRGYFKPRAADVDDAGEAQHGTERRRGDRGRASRAGAEPRPARGKPDNRRAPGTGSRNQFSPNPETTGGYSAEKTRHRQADSKRHGAPKRGGGSAGHPGGPPPRPPKRRGWK